MTLIELALFLINVVIGCFIGIRIYAASGSILFGVVGLIVGFLLSILFWILLRKILDVWYKIFPLRPPCRQGKCDSDDYRFNIELSKSIKKDVFVCKCGDKYIHRGRLFCELLDDGSIQPFMKHPFLFRKWSKNSSATNDFHYESKTGNDSGE
jgi:hypothetical protein